MTTKNETTRGVGPLVRWQDVDTLRREPHMDMVMINADAAIKWLEGNTHNRPIRDGRVTQYAQDMASGRWRFTHEGICFDNTGRLIDGQHRLYAVLEAGKPIRMAVWTGLDPESQAFIDQGLMRSVVDVMKLSGDTVITGFRAAIARRMYIGTRTQVTLSRPEWIEFIREHGKALDFVIEDCFAKRKVLRVMPAPVGAALARASYHEDKERLVVFGHIMLDGLNAGLRESGAINLRNWLLQGAPSDKSAAVGREVLIYMKSQRAILAVLRGEQMRNLYPMREEYWPLPGEARKTAMGSKRAQPRGARGKTS